MTTTQINGALVLAVLSYLLGAIPFGYLLGRARGVDIRKTGSGNIGATNLGRTLGRKWGYLCFVLDVGKGLAPTLFAGWWLRQAAEPSGATASLTHGMQLAWLGVGTAAIIGHMFPVYLGFRGGKGVATSLGTVLGIYPYFTLVAPLALLVWLLMWFWKHYVSLASICAAVAFPLFFAALIALEERWIFTRLWPLLIFAALMGALVVIRHRTNIARLWAGTENRSQPLRSRKAT